MNPLHILLIDLDSPCPTEHCLRLAEMMQHSLPVGEMRLQTTTMFPSTPTAATPDLILLRPSCEQPLEALCTFRRDWDTTPILGLFCRGWENPQRVLHTLLTGLDDFVSCPFTEIDLFPRLQRLLPGQRVEGTASPMKLAGTPLHFEFLVGASANFLRIIEKIPRLAQPDAPVLILGETGTGKELVARAIHAHSARQRQPFIPVNCGTLPDHLFENELFGHAKGAFTDASSAEKGLVAEAEGGTLLLDEIDTLSPAAQVKLLRFLQHREYRQLGSAKNRVADVRILAATNADLWQYVQAKRFREDLYHRLNVLSLVVPPLRERTEDILLLAHHFLTVYRKQHGREALGGSLEQVVDARRAERGGVRAADAGALNRPVEGADLAGDAAAEVAVVEEPQRAGELEVVEEPLVAHDRDAELGVGLVRVEVALGRVLVVVRALA